MSDKVTKYMESLWKKGKERQRLTEQLVALVARVANEIAATVPDGTRVQVPGVGTLEVVNYRSNVGNLRRLVVCDSHGTGLDLRYSLENDTPGSRYYLHGDFQCMIRVAEPEHFLAFANHLPEVLAAFEAAEDKAITALRAGFEKLREVAEAEPAAPAAN